MCYLNEENLGGIIMVKVNVLNGEVSDKEIKAYIANGRNKYPNKLIDAMDIELDGDFVNVKYYLKDIPFQRIRRITGYLVGTIDRFNDAKKSEVYDRVKHNV
jgi:hypothetical protein